MGVIRRVITMTPVLTVAGAYTANDQVGAVNTLAGAAAATGSVAEIESMSLVDKDKRNQALDIFFFDEIPVPISVDNGAFDMTDARMGTGFKAAIRVVAGDYMDAANCSVVNLKRIGALVKALASSKDIYAIVVTRGTPTYAAGALVFNFTFRQGGR
jgi:hypothetical protein